MKKIFRHKEFPLRIHSLAFDAIVSEEISSQSLIPLQRFSTIVQHSFSKESIEKLFSMSFLMEDVFLLWSPFANQRGIKMSLNVPLPIHRYWCLFIGQESLVCFFLSEVTLIIIQF